MSMKLKTSVLTLALAGLLGPAVVGGAVGIISAPALAQTAPDGQAGGETGAEASGTAEQAIPELLQGDAFADVEARPGPRGARIVTGSIADTGKDFDAILSRDGTLLGIRTAEGSSLPQAVRDALLPEAARANPVLSEIAEMNAIGRRNGAVMASGQDASGDKVRVGFDAEGELVLFTRGARSDHAGPWMSGRGNWSGDGMRPRGDMAPHGKGPHGERGARKAPPRDRDARQDRAPRPAPAVDEAALRAALEGAGYREAGEIRPGPRGVVIDAVNPQGEEVTVFATPDGEVMRETAR